MAFDEHYLGRALANLVQNALEHTPAGGSVVVRAHLGAAPADTVEVEVADTSRRGHRPPTSSRTCSIGSSGATNPVPRGGAAQAWDWRSCGSQLPPTEGRWEWTADQERARA